MTPATTAAAAMTDASWRQPNRYRTRSVSKATIPRAAAPARARAAGPSMASRSCTPLSTQPRPAAHDTATHTRATDHSRTAHANRHPRPTSSGRAAATTNAQPRGEAPTGPIWKRSSAPNPGAWVGDGAAPANAAHSRPDRTKCRLHGNSRTKATPMAPVAVVSERSEARAPPTSTDPRTNPRATTPVTSARDGTRAPATASRTPSLRIADRRRGASPGDPHGSRPVDLARAPTSHGATR